MHAEGQARRIHFLPASQTGNAGDELINRATVDALRRYGELVVNDLATPRWFVDAIAARDDRRYSEFASRRFYVSLATTLLRRKLGAGGPRHCVVLAPGHTARRGIRAAAAALTWYLKLALLRLLGCRIVRAGFSIGPFDRLNGWVEALGARAFDLYGVRDTASLALARRCGISRACHFPDLAWTFRPRHEEPAPAGENGPVVVSCRSNAYGTVHDARYLVPIRDRLIELLGTPGLAGRRIVVSHQVVSDREASVALHAALAARGFDVELLDPRLSIAAAARLYGRARCVITNRLHVLLLAAQCGSLPVALANGPDNAKITGILADNDLADLAIDVAAQAGSAGDRIEALLRERRQVIARIRVASEENARRIEQGFAHAFRAQEPRTSTPGEARVLP